MDDQQVLNWVGAFLILFVGKKYDGGKRLAEVKQLYNHFQVLCSYDSFVIEVIIIQFFFEAEVESEPVLLKDPLILLKSTFFPLINRDFSCYSDL